MLAHDGSGRPWPRHRRRRLRRTRRYRRGRDRRASLKRSASARWIRVHHHRAMSLPHHLRELAQDALTPRAVAQSGNSASPSTRIRCTFLISTKHGDLAGILQQNVDAARLAVANLAAQRRVAAEPLDLAGRDRLRDEPVGVTGIDADERRSAPEVRFDHLPRVGVLACRAVAAREPDRGAGVGQSQHRAGVGTACGHGLTAGESRRPQGSACSVSAVDRAAGGRRIAWGPRVGSRPRRRQQQSCSSEVSPATASGAKPWRANFAERAGA